MFEDYSDEKFYSIPSQTYHPSHSKHSSCSSTTSSVDTSTISLALTSYPEKYDELDPPPYTYIFYNTIDDKPLPPLPDSNPNTEQRERKVRFVAEKPLPPLPTTRVRKRSAANMEYAWWTKRWNMSEEEYEKVAGEKETGGGSVGKFKEEF